MHQCGLSQHIAKSGNALRNPLRTSSGTLLRTCKGGQKPLNPKKSSNPHSPQKLWDREEYLAPGWIEGARV
jgi:hypothetical protein